MCVRVAIPTSVVYDRWREMWIAIIKVVVGVPCLLWSCFPFSHLQSSAVQVISDSDEYAVTFCSCCIVAQQNNCVAIQFLFLIEHWYKAATAAEDCGDTRLIRSVHVYIVIIISQWFSRLVPRELCCVNCAEEGEIRVNLIVIYTWIIVKWKMCLFDLWSSCIRWLWWWWSPVMFYDLIW